MSKSFVMRAAMGLAALICVTVVLEGQASACRGKLFGGRHRGGCCCEAEASCGCAAEPSCAAPEQSCGCEVVEESCGCAAEPSCGCSSNGRKHRLFGGRRHRGGCCESSCGAPAECGCGAPADGMPADGAVPPAPEAPAT